MSDVLSQDEIDELLKQMNNGNASDVVIETSKKDKIVKDHDFNNPIKFNKEQLRSFEIIYDNYSRMVSSFLTAYLRTTCQVEFVNAEELMYKDFNVTLVNPVILAVVDFAPLKGSIILQLSANLGYSIIDRVLGGPGAGMKRLRDFSEIEKILLERVIRQLLIFLVEPWENITALRPKLEKIETNSQFSQIISPNSKTALITLNIKLGSAEGLMNFCIPYTVLEPVIDKLSTKAWFKQNTDDDAVDYRGDIESKLEKAQVPISVIMGRTNITIQDFVNLQVGDIIPLDSYITSDLDVMVGNLLKFKAKPGVFKNKNAIQITSLIKKEE